MNSNPEKTPVKTTERDMQIYIFTGLGLLIALTILFAGLGQPSSQDTPFYLIIYLGPIVLSGFSLFFMRDIKFESLREAILSKNAIIRMTNLFSLFIGLFAITDLIFI